MRSVSPTARELAETNLACLPPRFVYREGQATYEAVQEVFWACMVEVVARLLGGPGFPDSVRVGREQVPIPVGAGHWQALEAEVGLDKAHLREPVREVLESQLRRRPPSRAPLLPPGENLAERCGVRLLGMVLLACYLDQLAEGGVPKDFGYEFRELTRLARQSLD